MVGGVVDEQAKVEVTSLVCILVVQLLKIVSKYSEKRRGKSYDVEWE